MASYEHDYEKMARAALGLWAASNEGSRVISPALPLPVSECLIAHGWAKRGTGGGIDVTPSGARLGKRVLRREFSKSRAQSAKSGARKQLVDAEQLENCVVLRCTAKLLKELRVNPVEPPTGLPIEREWHANLLRIDRKKCIMFTHTLSLYTIALLGTRRATYDRLDQEFLKALSSQMQLDGIPEHQLVLPPEAPTLLFAKTNNRAVLGSMNDLAYHLDLTAEHEGGLSNLAPREVTRRLNYMPMIGYLGGEYSRDAFAKVIGAPKAPIRLPF